MKSASVSQAKNQLSALLDLVRRGETIVILDRGVPVARLEPVTALPADPEGRLARLERQGVIRRGGTAATDRLLDQPPPRPAGGASALAALNQERAEGR